MLINHASITEKSYKQLTLLARTDSFSYAIKDLISNEVAPADDISLESETSRVADRYASAFEHQPWGNERFDQVILLHQNTYNTLVPEPLFDERFAGNYLQYNTKVFETDSFAWDALPAYGMQQVYIPFDDITALVQARFARVTSMHAASVLIPRLLDRTKNNDEKTMFVHVSDRCFEIVVAQNQKLLLYNAFDYRTAEDFLYYVLFCAEQLNLNPESFRLEMLGSVRENTPEFELTYRYIRNVSLLQPDASVENPDRWRNHFILMHA